MVKSILARNRDVIFAILVGVASFISFLLIYGYKVLIPTNVSWLMSGSDLTQHYLGWVAFRKSKWFFPIGLMDTLTYPETVSVIFPDALPILAVIFKLLSPILPSDFQYFGMWGAFCFVMQGCLSARIIKKLTKDDIVAFVGGILCVFSPYMLWRMFMQTALASQWIILLALYLLFAYDDYSNNRKIYIEIAIIAVLCASVHLYYVLMCGIVISGICLLDILKNKRVSRSVIMIIEFVGIVAFIVALLGGFSSGVNVSNGGLGWYSFNLDGMFNSQGWSCLLLDLPLHGEGQIDGFAYLGLGGIILFIISAIIFVVRGYLQSVWKYYRFEFISIAYILAVSIFVASAPIVTLGGKVIVNIPLAEVIASAWSMFRSSGRVVWVACYIVILVSLAILSKWSEKNRGIGCAILCLLLCIQIYDSHESLSDRRTFIKDNFDYENPVKDSQVLKQFCDIKGARHIICFEPLDIDNMYNYTEWALANGLDVNTFYLARGTGDTYKVYRDYALVNPDEDTLFILPYSDILNCGSCDLHFYEENGLIFGYVNELEGLKELEEKDFYRVFELNNDKFLDEEDGYGTSRGRVIYPGGHSYGPGWELMPGAYRVTIEGEFSADDIGLKLVDKDMEIAAYDFQNDEKNEISVEIELSERINSMEFVINNISEENVLLKSIKVECI